MPLDGHSWGALCARGLGPRHSLALTWVDAKCSLSYPNKEIHIYQRIGFSYVSLVYRFLNSNPVIGA